MRSLRVVTYGKVSDPNNFGAWPHFIWQSLVAAGAPAVPHDLKRSNECKLQRIMWTARQMVHGGEYRGFMFSNDFLEAAWTGSPPIPSGDGLLNTWQLYPESVLARAERGDVSLFYYLDLNLRELFEEWMPASDAKRPSPQQMESAIARERRGYMAARKIITFTRRTAEGIARRYQIDPEKIATVVPGAGISDDAIDGVPSAIFTEANEFVVGFIGVDYRRKGLLKLAAAVQLARQSGVPIKLRIIGADPPELRDAAGLEVVGYVNKRHEMRRFVELVGGCHLGCLLSSSEGLGIALLEFLRLGVPIVASRIKGTQEIIRDEFGLPVESDASPEEIATVLKRVACDPAEYARLRAGAQQARDWASWRRAGTSLRDAIETGGPL